MKRLTISLKPTRAMEVNRGAIRYLKLVYVICANKRIPYTNGKSSIVYIGTTRLGISRVAASAAFRSDSILGLHGVNSFHVRILTCRGRQKVRTWQRLERALLLEFRARHGGVPRFNIAGKNFVETNEFDDNFFSRKRVRDILDDLG